MWRDKVIKLPFRSIQLLNSTSRSKFSIQCNRLCTDFTSCKPFSPIFLRYLTSSTGRLQEQLHVSQPFSPTQSPSKGYSGVTSLDEIAKGVVHLQCKSSAEGGICDVYLVGTCHLSQKSCEDVKAVISYLKPQVVFLELCMSRGKCLTDQHFKVPTMSEMFNLWKNKKANVFWILYGWSLAKMGSELGMGPGGEFRVAYEEARRYGAHVVLGDRPIQITMRKMWNGMTMWHLTKFLCHELVFSKQNDQDKQRIFKMLEEFKDEDMIVIITKMLQMEMDRDELSERLQMMSMHFPSLMEVLIDERDKYMSRGLWNAARKHRSVVAVVGSGHLSGIEKYWMQPFEVQSLLEVPSEKKGFGMFNIFSIIKAAASAAVASGNNLWSKK